MQWLPRSASESVFPSMIDTYFERPSPLTCVSFATVTYVQTRQTSMFKGSLFGSLTTMNTRALAARASTQICHGACGSCPCRSRPLRLCVPADPVPAPITWRLLLIITFKRILPMQLLHMRLRHSCGQHGRCDQGVPGRMSHMPHGRALGGWGRERGEGARMDFFSLPIRKKGGRG